MKAIQSLSCLFLLAALVPAARAIEVNDLSHVPSIYGRYAPAGDCKRQPRILVDATGMTFEIGGKQQHVSRMEHAVSYGGNFYEGDSQWFFPFGNEDHRPILMTFNAGEKAGVLLIEGHDEGWKGGPALQPDNKALVQGSPYGLCK